MSKVSMAQAARIFAVSRPTLAKHLKDGKISGEKTIKGKHEFWQIDMAELARVYPRRAEVAAREHDKFTKADTPAAPDLQAEIKLLQAKLEAAEQLAEERARHIEDLRALLPGPDQSHVRRGLIAELSDIIRGRNK